MADAKIQIAEGTKVYVEPDTVSGRYVDIEGTVTKQTRASWGESYRDLHYVPVCGKGETSVYIESSGVGGLKYEYWRGYYHKSSLAFWPTQGFKLFKTYDITPGHTTCLPTKSLEGGLYRLEARLDAVLASLRK